MIRISTKTLELLELEYLNMIKTYFKYKKVKKDKKGNVDNVDKLEGIFRGKKNLEYKMLKYFHNNLEKIILAKPENIKQTYNDFLAEFSFNPANKQHVIQLEKFKDRMVLYYKSFFQKEIVKNGEKFNYGRFIAKKMKIKVCPYCNHNYIFTLNDYANKINSRPDFDHFYPKAKYPLLALSLYNLIPSCSVCNKVKKEEEITFYPYLKSYDETVSFRVHSEGNENPHEWITGEGKIGIKVVHSYNGIDDTVDNDRSTIVKKLGIDKVYDEHSEYAEEILDKIFAYNKSYYNAMISSFDGLGKTSDQIESIIWSAYLQDVGNRPMSKLTSDILEQLKIKRIKI